MPEAQRAAREGREWAVLMDRLATIAASPGDNPAMRHAARAMRRAGRAAVNTYPARLPRAS